MYKDTLDMLSTLGLKRDEAKVYLACLRNKGGLFVHQITQASRVKRSTVDLILKRLLGKNFISSFRDGSRRKFVAASPESLIFDLQRNLEDFRAIVPLLTRLGSNTEQTRVTLHEGSEGVRTAFDTILLTLKDLPEKDRIYYCYSSGREVEGIRPRLRREFIDRRVQSGIKVHMISCRNTPDKAWTTSNKDLRQTKMFDGKKYPFGLEVGFVDDKIVFISTAKPVGCVILHNNITAYSMRSIFKLLWDMLGPPEGDPTEFLAN